ncbi:hypothetical protein [Nocardia grenadensis]
MQRRRFLTLAGTAITAPARQWLLAAGVGSLAHTSAPGSGRPPSTKSTA